MSNTLHRLWKDMFHRQMFIDEWRKEGTEVDRDRGFRHGLQIFVMCHKGKLPVTGSPCIFTCPGFWLFPKHVLCVCVCVAQSCPTLCDPMGCSPPSSPVHGILQAGILESVAISWWRLTRKGPLLNGAVCLSLAEKHRGRRWVDAGISQTVPLGPMGLCGSLCRNSLNFSF